ncbi:MAG: dockerin type I repeat-containing protein [Ruminococcus sp.]|nr:dockerin type I repeat-containing protein [Ruminococcus sp.]
MPETTIAGYVNADGEFSIADVVLLQKWLLAVPDTKLADWKAADLCEDNKLNVFDMCLMRRKLVNG